jgi:multidrug efflux pump subunit AcrA (membrane-fusion protein)
MNRQMKESDYTMIEQSPVHPPLPEEAPASSAAVPASQAPAGTAAAGPASGHARAKHLLFNVVIPLLILAAGAGFVVAMGSIQPKAREQDDQSPTGRLRRLPAADVTRVLSMDAVGKPLEMVVDGVVVPFREVQIAAEVSGRIIERSDLVRAGNHVTAGQLLCRIDPTDYQQEVLRLTRAREQDYEALKEVDQEVANTGASLEINKQEIELAQRELNRLQSLPRGFASETELDQAQRALLAARQNRVSLDNQMNLLAARRGRLEASERLATTQLETATINLERCEVRSPASGVIVREDAQLNSFIQRGSPIITLEDISKAEVAVNLRMDQLYWILDQDRSTSAALAADPAVIEPAVAGGYSIPTTPAIIEYEVAGLGGKTYRWEGKLVRYDGIGLDSRSRMIPVRIEVDAPERLVSTAGSPAATGPTALVRGMYVRVRLLIKPRTPLVAIPSLAIRPGNRVWRFTPDPSVLDEPLPAQLATETAEAGRRDGEDTSNPESNDAVVTSASNAATDFDPAQWVPGRVTALANLTAVDSLWLSEEVAGDEPASPVQRQERRYWICDVRGGELSGGDWVVVSPLGELGRELGETPLPTRVPLSQVQP